MVASLSCTLSLEPKATQPCAGRGWLDGYNFLIWGVCSVARHSCDSGGGVGDPKLSSLTSNSTCLIIDLSVLETACKVWQAQALQEFNNRSAWVVAYFTSCLCLLLQLAENLGIYIYICFSLRYCKHTAGRPTLKYKASMYIYTHIHLFVVPKKYAWHKHLEAR